MWSSVQRQAGPRRVFSQDSEWETESDMTGTAAERMQREVLMDVVRATRSRASQTSEEEKREERELLHAGEG